MMSRAAQQPIRERQRRSYDTTTGRVLWVRAEDDVTMATDRTVLVSPTDDVISRGRPVTVREPKTPPAPAGRREES